MKRLLFLLFCLESILIMFADDGNPAAINLQHNGPGNHSGIPLPADMPDVYYDNSNQQIIVDGLGVVTYYDVEIASATNWTVYISTQVSGSYGTIDISSLPQGEYVITIDSSTGNSFEGYFDIIILNTNDKN
ncbi:MAG: DUF3244 domain-containing protein [Muribaculaceae bacterium]|nr:DUF3244 domain-containing protein [Muribaculaceae bacterium]